MYGFVLVASSVNIVELIDLRTGSSTHELRGHKNSVLTCNWSPVEQYLLATGGMDKSILMWDVRSSKSFLAALEEKNDYNKHATAHSGYVNGLKFTGDGLFLTSFGTDENIKFWEILNGSLLKKDYPKIKNNAKRNIQFAISNNCKHPILYLPSEGDIFVIDLFSGTEIKTLNGHFHSVNCCYYRESFQELYSGGNDRNVLLWTADEYENETMNSNEQNKILHTKSKTADDWSDDEN